MGKDKIDLKKFSTPKQTIIPIINGYGDYQARIFKLDNENGYFLVKLGDNAKKVREATALEIHQFLQLLPKLTGIAYGEQIIPLNFSSAKFQGYQQTAYCNFLNAELGMIVIARRWANFMLLYDRISFSKQQILILKIKKLAENNLSLKDLSDVTPEMRYFYLLLSMDLAHIRQWQQLDDAALSFEEKKKRIAQFRESLAGRIQKTVEDAGGKLVRFTKKGTGFDVVWKIKDQILHSTINQDFRILELGYCASGYDRDHSLSSAILLAKEFERDGLLHITRE